MRVIYINLGTIIRCLRRLEELIKQLIASAVLIENHSLKEKLEQASDLIRRGIIFAASLYLST
jgi:ATP-dependent RNA helicase DOB1